MATDDIRVSDMTPHREGSTGGNLGERYGGAGEGAGGVDDAREEMSDYDAVDTSRGMSSGQSNGTGGYNTDTTNTQGTTDVHTGDSTG